MRKCTRFCVAALFFFSTTSSGQSSRSPESAGYTGLGAYSIQHSDIFSFIANQASLAQLKNASLAFYGERKFLLNELNDFTAVAGIVTPSGNFGLKAKYAGFSEYNETQLGLAYGRKLGAKVDAGVQFNYNGIRINNYGNAAAISFEAGTVIHITDRLHAGVHISNPVGGRFGKHGEEKLASVYTAGFGYEASEKFFFGAAIEKEEDQPVNVKAGMQYRPVSQLLLRTGIASATSSLWFGAGLWFRSFRVDITASYHPQLGVSPGLLLLYNFSKQGQ